MDAATIKDKIPVDQIKRQARRAVRKVKSVPKPAILGAAVGAGHLAGVLRGKAQSSGPQHSFIRDAAVTAPESGLGAIIGGLHGAYSGVSKGITLAVGGHMLASSGLIGRKAQSISDGMSLLSAASMGGRYGIISGGLKGAAQGAMEISESAVKRKYNTKKAAYEVRKETMDYFANKPKKTDPWIPKAHNPARRITKGDARVTMPLPNKDAVRRIGTKGKLAIGAGTAVGAALIGAALHKKAKKSGHSPSSQN